MFLVPLYWIAMSAAAWVAIYEVIKNPHYWPKTVHGLHIDNKKAMTQAAKVIGRELVDYHPKHKPIKPTEILITPSHM